MTPKTNEKIRDVFCQAFTGEDGKMAAIIGGDTYVGAENNYQPIRHSLQLDLEGLLRLQERIADAIGGIAKAYNERLR